MVSSRSAGSYWGEPQYFTRDSNDQEPNKVAYTVISKITSNDNVDCTFVNNYKTTARYAYIKLEELRTRNGYDGYQGKKFCDVTTLSYPSWEPERVSEIIYWTENGLKHYKLQDVNTTPWPKINEYVEVANSPDL